MADQMTKDKTTPVTEQQVIEFLHRNPDFLKSHPELLSVLTPPSRELGGDVVDFQQFQLKNLQKNSKSLKGKYESLVDFCRDNLSVQGQVHDAVLRLVRAADLEQLLEVITIDLVSLFDLDVVRLAVESEAAEFYETYYTEHNYSGIVFIPTGTAERLLGGKKSLLVDEAKAQALPGFAEIFADCSGLIQSFALLPLEQERLDYNILLAFGVRAKGRFSPGQGIELLSFLARIVALRLDGYLGDLGE